MATLSYQIGAIFLLCAMLMFGTMSGSLSRLRISPAVAITLTLLGLLAAAWQWLPQLDWSFLHESPAAISTAKPAAPVPQPKAAKTRPHVEVWHTTVIESSPQEAPAVPGTVESTPVLPQRTKVEAGSPYDSKVKRAAKAVGRFFSPQN